MEEEYLRKIRPTQNDRNDEDSQNAKTSPRLVTTTPVLFTEFSLSPTPLIDIRKRKFYDVHVKKHMTTELNALPFEAILDCFRKHLKHFYNWIQVGGNYF
jgi:hypothetical protein